MDFRLDPDDELYRQELRRFAIQAPRARHRSGTSSVLSGASSVSSGGEGGVCLMPSERKSCSAAAADWAGRTPPVTVARVCAMLPSATAGRKPVEIRRGPATCLLYTS